MVLQRNVGNRTAIPRTWGCTVGKWKKCFACSLHMQVESSLWRLVPHEHFDGTQPLSRTAQGTGASACTGVWKSSGEQDCNSAQRSDVELRSSDPVLDLLGRSLKQDWQQWMSAEQTDALQK
eukprot:3253171-Amphidinium_carterae.1